MYVAPAVTHNDVPDFPRKLFVKGVSPKITQQQFFSFFSQFGHVKDSIIVHHQDTGNSREFGFVTFTQGDVAQIVLRLAEEGELILDNKVLSVREAVKHPQSDEQTRGKKIFVGGLEPSLTDREFREYFRQYGKVVESLIMRQPSSGRSRGFGFIVYAFQEVAERVCTEIHTIKRQVVSCKIAVPTTSAPGSSITNSAYPVMEPPTVPNNPNTPEYAVCDNEKTTKIFIGGIPYDTTEDHLKEFFASIGGQVVSGEVIRGRGFGFVTFADREAVDKVLKEQAERGSLSLRGKPVSVKLAVANAGEKKAKGTVILRLLLLF